MGIAFTHIAVDQQYTLVGLADHRRKVGADKGLPDRRANPGEHQDIVLCLHHGEVEAGAQAAHGFNRQIGRVTHCQQLALLVTLNTLNGLDAIPRFLPFRQRNAGVYADAILFQHLRAFDTAVEQ